MNLLTPILAQRLQVDILVPTKSTKLVATKQRGTHFLTSKY